MHKRQFLTNAALCAAWLCAVALCFALLQNKVVYNAVSGVVKTYRVKQAEDGSKSVTREKQPFNRIENERLLQWDADIYRLMSQHLYDPEYVWPGYVASFPAVPHGVAAHGSLAHRNLSAQLCPVCGWAAGVDCRRHQG